MFNILHPDPTPAWKEIDDTEITHNDFTAVPVDERLRDALSQQLDRPLLSVRPHPDNDNIQAMDELLDSLPKAKTETTQSFLRRSSTRTNHSAAHSFEIRYAKPTESVAGDERLLTIQYVPASQTVDRFQGQLQTYYPDSHFTRRLPGEDIPPEPLLPVDDHQHPEAQRYIAGATLALRRYDLFPIKNIELEDFRTDPLASVISTMTNPEQDATAADADVIIQIMFRPTHRTWREGVDDGPSVREMASALTETTEKRMRRVITTEWVPQEPTTVDKRVANLLEDQQGMRGWEMAIRIFAISIDPAIARRRCETTAAMFDNYYESSCEQTFRSVPLTDTNTLQTVTAATARDWATADNAPVMTKAQRELCGLVNIPTASDIQSNKVRWSLTKPGDGVPPKTARADFNALGVAGASWAEKYLAMVNNVESGDPIWFGRGVKHGKEAGVFDKWLKRPTFVLGESGNGKTTFLINVVAQALSRGDGALIIDPPGQDADDFIAEWPEDRPEEDLIVLDLDREDLRPQFNFLDIPGIGDEIEKDSYAATRMIEGLADDLEAMVAQAGGTDKYVGSAMKRVMRAAIRGVLKSDRDAHLLDLACLVSTQENLEQFSDWMDEEQIAFIRERARQYAENKTDNDLDPLAGRMDEWVHNDIIRDMIATRDPSFSIHEAVKEGKVIVVKFGDGSGSNLQQLLSTILIRRTYTSKQLIGDEDPFWLFCDEFDSVVTPQSHMETIISESRKFNYRCFLCCQSPANQLHQSIKDAVEDNARTLVAFNPGGESNAKYAASKHTIDWTTFQDVDPFKFYLSTPDADNNTTDSFLVESPRPLEEIREEVKGIGPRTQADIDALKQRSLERYGTRIKSAEEQQSESYFAGGRRDVAPDSDDSASVSDDRRDMLETLSCKAAYDAVLHQTKEQYLDSLIDMTDEPDLFDTWVEVGREADNPDDEPTGVYKRVLRYLRDVDPHAEQFHMGVFTSVVESLSELEIQEQDDVTHIRCTEDAPTRFKGTGNSRTSGGLAHGKMLQEAYEHLTRLGLEITIVEQTGSRDVDAVGKIRETLPEHEQVKRDEISQREYQTAREQFKQDHPLLYALTDGEDVTIEAEKSTSRSPGKTARNLAKAYDQRQKCLFLAAPDRVHRVYNGLTDPPFVRATDNSRSRLYHVNRINVGGENPLRPNTTEENYWYLDHDTDDLVLVDGSEDDELARFDSLDAATSSLDAYPADTRSIDETRIGKNKDLRYVKTPFDPRDAFGEDPPTDEDYEILSFDGDSLLCLLDGKLGPLSRLLNDSNARPSVTTSEADGDAEQTEAAVSDATQPSDNDLYIDLDD